ncbi:MAG: cadmium-translocating P-type ATPase [Erysipelotrichaceae bacterium]|nr:cadmium-translocating P-type ATPase [Erysipelotrichaceae bacterium]
MKFKVTGLDCAHCAAKLEHELQKVDGITSLTVDFMGQKIICESEMDEHELLHRLQEVTNTVEEGVVISCMHHHHHHEHHHEHEKCGCGHHHEHKHEHHHHEEKCCCGHNHHEHDEHCDCEHHHEHCECGHDHKHEHHEEHKHHHGRKKLKVVGLDCANCATKLERELQKIEDITNVTIDFMGQKIVYDSNLDEKHVIMRMQKVADVVEPGVMIQTFDEVHEHHEVKNYMVLRIVVAGLCLLASFVFEAYGLYFAILGYLVIGYDIILRSIKNIAKGNWMDENFLMMIATFGAFYVQEFHEAVGVMLFYQVGEYFQDLAVKRSRHSITSLLDLKPDSANLKHGDYVHTVHPEVLKVNDVIVVYPSEKIAVDGVIVEGSSTLDMSMLTGESLPQEKNVNDEVLSGSINLQSVLTIRVTKVYEESTASKILDLVENASSQKAEAEKFITKFARYYTPIVVGIALVIGFVLPLVSSLTFTETMYRACIFLVVSCPCALVISIPLSFFGGIGGASRKGILLKGGNYLEMMTKVDTFVFDKTGTITTGNFEVAEIVSEHEDMLAMCAHLESYSLHPIAQSIVKAYGKEVDRTKISNMQEKQGHGLVGVYNSKELVVGNEKLMKEYHISYPSVDTIGTIVYVGYDQQFLGYFVIKDMIKQESKEMLSALHSYGIESVMLSGDANAIVQSVGQEVGITQCYGELLPQDKVYKVEELIASGKIVAFVGDGMNDAPVLARSHVGIAMGQKGSDAAIEVADVIIMQDALDKLLVLKKLAHKTMAIVKQNIIFALGVKILVMVLGAFGIANMWLAVFADVGVALLAILNAMRALQ